MLMSVPAFTAKSAWLLRNLKEIKLNRFTRMHLGTRGFASSRSRQQRTAAEPWSLLRAQPRLAGSDGGWIHQSSLRETNPNNSCLEGVIFLPASPAGLGGWFASWCISTARGTPRVSAVFGVSR